MIVIFTNQSGMGTGKNFDKPKWKEAVSDLAEIMFKDVPESKSYYLAVYVAKTYDMYRKPNIGLWNLMKDDFKDQFNMNKIDISKKSFFCGDAAGRINPGPYKKKLYPSSKAGDFGDTDRKFALNLRISYLTPEEFYMKDPPMDPPFKLKGFDPNKFLTEYKKTKYKFKPRSKELIIVVGPPGSGKSTLVKEYIEPTGYIVINQDTCKTQAKCLQMADEAMRAGQNVVIDNTNPDIFSRMKYTGIAQDNHYKHIRCIVMKTDMELAKHLNNVRHVYSQGIIRKINHIVYAVFKKNFARPLIEEHFDLIEEVNLPFDFSLLDDPAWCKAFMMWSESK